METAKFKKGQTVYMGRGKHERELIIAKVHKNPLLPIHQYTFEAPNDGFACGEQSIRAKKEGRDLTISECLVDDKEMEFRVNTLASASRKVINEDDSDLNLSKLPLWDSVRVEFKPSLDMCEWFKEYADGRLIIHVDSGQGHFVRMLKMAKARVTGIEKHFNKQKWIEWRMMRFPNQPLDVNEILEGTLEDRKRIVEGLGDNALLVFTRPKDNENLHYAIQNFMGKSEIVLVGLPTDLPSDSPWKVVEHGGVSEDGELVYSLK